MRLQTGLKIGGVIVLAGLLSGCGDRYAPPTPQPGPTSLESKFGAAFAAIFDASPTSQPVVPTDSSVPPLAPADTPIPT